ncbi:hypothetical protein [Mangrovihabitans endophyticus]|uniref:Uncharacterized protein n=1 Tax=Mangrovihabitans endophyticus TaxID=1751298 RepID=A0A8J3FPR5_9ACTN|nr:hypothetical protein [Mangrovihabitans endophyticus]GGK94845.1 hypothetical protein GCM10012284_31130 [Mangrovihabitans endophyticus]
MAGRAEGDAVQLTYCHDTTAADWLAQASTPAMQLITMGPAGFPAYARLRFIPDPSHPGQVEADVEVPDDHPTDCALTGWALHRLAAFTATPGDCFFCVWDGYSDVKLPPEAMDGAMVELPHRRYALLRGPLRGIDTWQDDIGGWPPAFVWPYDRSWCFTSDVDPHWAGIGATRAAVDALLNDAELDVVRARPDEPQPTYY